MSWLLHFYMLIWLAYSWFTMLGSFPVHINVTQLHIYMYSFSFRLFSHVGYHSVLGRVPCDTQKVLADYLAYTESVCMFTPHSWFYPSLWLLLRLLPWTLGCISFWIFILFGYNAQEWDCWVIWIARCYSVLIFCKINVHLFFKITKNKCHLKFYSLGRDNHN